MEDKDKVRAYNQMYYIQNRDALREKRKVLYSENPEYREKARMRAVARNVQRKMEIGKVGREGRGYNIPKIVLIDGEQVRVHSVKEFADRVGRNVQTIRSWETKGVIPSATFVDERGRRWYSERHMDIIARTYQAIIEKGGTDIASFKALVEDEFAKK